MADAFGGAFGAYVDVAGIIVADAQTDVAQALQVFAALYGITLTAASGVAGSFVLTTSVSSPHPDFDKIDIEVRTQMGKELSALWDAVDAGPIA